MKAVFKVLVTCPWLTAAKEELYILHMVYLAPLRFGVWIRPCVKFTKLAVVWLDSLWAGEYYYFFEVLF